MKTNKTTLLCLLILGCTTTIFSQVHFFYAPTATYLPGLSQQNDVIISLSQFKTNLKLSAPQLMLQQSEIILGYSPVKHLGLWFSRYTSTYDQPLLSAHLDYQHVELAFGGYHPLTSLWPKDLSFQGGLYSSVGFGESNILYPRTETSSFSYRRFMVQGAIEVLGIRDYFSICFGLRYVHLQFTKGEVIGILQDDLVSYANRIERQSIFHFPEVFSRMEAGLPMCKLFASLNMSPINGRLDIPTKTHVFTVGMVCHFNKIFRMQKKRKKRRRKIRRRRFY